MLAFLSALLYCSVQAFAEAAIEFVVSHHHDDDTASHEHAAPVCSGGHRHDNSATPGADGQNDICCSQLNGIISQWKNTTPAAKNLLVAATVIHVEQTSFVTPLATRSWLLHDKAPPFSPRHNLFYFINFPPHAPPLSLSCWARHSLHKIAGWEKCAQPFLRPKPLSQRYSHFYLIKKSCSVE